MTQASWKRIALGAIVLLACLTTRPVCARPADTLAATAAWEPAATEEVRDRLFAWLDERQVAEDTRAKVAELWGDDAPEATGVELLTRVAETVALVDDNARELVDLCSRPRTDAVPGEQSWLSGGETPAWVAANLRLLYGRWLVHQSLLDEARAQLDGLGPDDVVDPASLLFYQGVVYHRLLEKESGLKAVGQLLSGVDRSPRRYAAVARLIEADLKRLEVDSLDHIARRMEDVGRRLDLGRAGPKVRGIEDGVIESLDKLIDQMQSQQQQADASSGGNLQPGRPAEDSRIAGGKGPGEVTKRDVGRRAGWGDLPPKQREEALQQIGREFPSHYRDVIEQYFRKLANEGSR